MKNKYITISIELHKRISIKLIQFNLVTKQTLKIFGIAFNQYTTTPFYWIMITNHPTPAGGQPPFATVRDGTNGFYTVPMD